MKSKLLKLLYEYSANGKLVDGKYIQELIEIVVDSKDIVDYAGGLIITDKDSILRDPNSLLIAFSNSPFGCVSFSGDIIDQKKS